jgi:hypothetical protein
MRVALYTCVTGRYDALEPPAAIDPRLGYYCFTDDPKSVPPPWKVHPIVLAGRSSRDRNRYVKMHPHRLDPLVDYDVTVYVDGNMNVVGDVYELVEACMRDGAELFAYDHPFRTCLYEEGAACAAFGHDSIATISAQMQRYEQAGFPRGGGLYECGVLIRRQTPAVAALMEDWWDEYRQGAKRDQLAFPFLLWKHRIRFRSLGPSDPRFINKYFKLRPHVRQRSLRMTFHKLSNRYAPMLAMLTSLRTK